MYSNCLGPCCNPNPITPHPAPHHPQPAGPLVVYQAIGGRPAAYFELPVLVLHQNFLEPGVAPYLASGPLDGALQRRIAEQATASVMFRSQGVPLCGPWLEQYILHPRCPFTGATSLFSNIDRGTHPPIRPSHTYSRARPSIYICLTAPPDGASFFTPGYPIGVTKMFPGDAVLCHSIADENFNYGPGEAIFLRLYGDLGPPFPFGERHPTYQAQTPYIDPRLLLPARPSQDLGSPLQEFRAIREDEDVFAPTGKLQESINGLAAKMKAVSSQAVLTQAREVLKEKGRNTVKPKRDTLASRWDDNEMPAGDAPYSVGKASGTAGKKKRKSRAESVVGVPGEAKRGTGSVKKGQSGRSASASENAGGAGGPLLARTEKAKTDKLPGRVALPKLSSGAGVEMPSEVKDPAGPSRPPFTSFLPTTKYTSFDDYGGDDDTPEPLTKKLRL